MNRGCNNMNRKKILLCILGVILSLVLVLVVLLVWVNSYLSKAKTTPPGYTIREHTDEERIREAIERAFKESEPGTVKRPLESNFHLTLGADKSVTRDDHEGFRNLGWHIERDGECVLERVAENELVLDPKIQRKYCNSGKITIYLTAVVDGRYQRVSNIIEYNAVNDQNKESE